MGNAGAKEQALGLQVAALPEVLRLLVVDPDPAEVRRVEGSLKERLGDAVYVEMRPRLDDALLRLASGGIDAVLLDLTEPDARGGETIRRLRAAHARLPVLVLATDPDPATVVMVAADPFARLLSRSHAEGEVLVATLTSLLTHVAVSEQAQRDSHRSRFVAEHGGEWLAVVAPSGAFRSASRAAERLLGWSSEELAGMGWPDLVSDQESPIVERALAAVRADGAPRVVEVGLRTEQGAERRMRVTFGLDVDGKDLILLARPTSALAGPVGVDVIADAPVPLVVQAGDRIDRVNREFLRLVAHPDAGELVGVPFVSLVPHEDRARVQGLAAGLQAGGHDPLPVTFRLLRKEGPPVLVEGSAARLSGADAVVWSLRDVTSQRVQEGRLEAQWRWFRALTRNNADLLVVLDEDWTVRYANRSADPGSYDFEDRTGRTFLADVHPDDVARVEDALRAATAEPGTPQTVRFRVFGADARLHWLESVAIDHLDDPDVQGIIVNSRDVTERERQEAALRERTEELESLTYAMTHDLKTPLASMDWLIEELEEHGVIIDDTVATILDRLRANIGAMDDLVRDLLQFARIGQRTATEPVRLSGVIERVLTTLQGPADESRVRFEWDPKTFPSLWADETYLLQVFLNLLSNAVKYGKQGGQVWITSESVPKRGPKAWWRFEVVDEGPGVPEEYIERIFRPFERAPDPEGRSVSGTGVGLAIARKVARHYGGDLVAVNRPEGGARFILDLPYAMAQGPQGM